MAQYRRTNTAPVLQIAPSPISVSGQKRKLMGNDPIPRRESSPATMDPIKEAPPATIIEFKPCDYWKSLLNEWEVPILDSVGIEQDENPDKGVDFLQTTSARVQAYQNLELLAAVRRRDIATLRRIASENRASGGTMNACNRFGESILHLACRKGSLDVVQLLVGSDCDCSLLVRDDYGRTVLHDACWTVNPPWELIKLILKKAPVLWRVSDIRGHLAIQYVPKTAWPQWAAFLSKNKDLLQRIMVHSYHQIDILQQQVPSHSQQHQQVKQEAVVSAQDSSTNDASGFPPQSLPQHQQPATQQAMRQVEQQHLPMPLPTPASLPVSTHNSAEQLPSATVVDPAPQANPTISAAKATQAAVAKRSQTAQNMATSALSIGTGGGLFGTSAMQAQSVLARALAQANPAMVQAISHGQQQGQPLKQGLSTYSSSAVAESTAPTKVVPSVVIKDEPAAPQQQFPGPATAALDEALRAQSSTRSKSRSKIFMDQHPHNEPSKEETHKADSNHKKDDGSRSPIPYAPSISMIAARLKGYKKNNAAAAAAAAKEECQAQPQETSEQTIPINPLPAVPNPLLDSMSSDGKRVVAPFKQEQLQQGVPFSITTMENHPTPNPMMARHNQEQDVSSSDSNSSSDDNNMNGSGNSVSSLTIAASPSFLVANNGSDTTMNNCSTDTDSDRAVTSQSSSTKQDDDDDAAASHLAVAESHPMDTSTSTDQDGDVSNSKPSLFKIQNIIVG